MKTISYNGGLVLEAIDQGARYGFEIMRKAHLPSGTVYPLLRRMEAGGLVRSEWEETTRAHSDRRPARRYYAITEDGLTALAHARDLILARHAAVFGNAPAEGRAQ